MVNPYSPPSTIDSEADANAIARRRVAKPATALIVMSSIHSVIWSVFLISYGFAAAKGVAVGEDTIGLLMGIVQFFALIAICVCSAKMGHLKSFRMARIGAILSCVPGLTPFFVLGIPFGVWSLTLLRDGTIRSQFPTRANDEYGG